MDHLQLRCEDLHALYVVDLTSEMITYYGDEACVPRNINMLEKSYKKVQREKIPIPDAPSWSFLKNQYLNTKPLPQR